MDMSFDDFEAELPGILKALGEASPVHDDELARFNHLKKRFFAKLEGQDASTGPSLSETLLSVFSLGGKLLTKAEAALSFEPELAPATRSALGSPGRPSPVSFVAYPRGNVQLEVFHENQGTDTVLRTTLRNSKTLVEIRPITIRVTDMTGIDLIDPVQVAEAEAAPGLPNPTPGDYILRVLWQGGEEVARLRYEMKD